MLDRPEWFHDVIPLDPLIAPMVLFFQNNGIKTLQSCQGGEGHLCGKPTIDFEASTIDDIDRVYSLLKYNELDTGLIIGLMTGFFERNLGLRFGQAYWLWTHDQEFDVGWLNTYKHFVYNRVIKLVSMDEIKSITGGGQYKSEGYPTI